MRLPSHVLLMNIHLKKINELLPICAAAFFKLICVKDWSYAKNQIIFSTALFTFILPVHIQEFQTVSLDITTTLSIDRRQMGQNKKLATAV